MRLLGIAFMQRRDGRPAAPPSVGWYVGYVEANDEVWVFALNLATRDATDLPLRIQIAEDALETVRALPLK